MKLSLYELTIWDLGNIRGWKTTQHPDQEVQEEWTKKHIDEGMSYENFLIWWNGYKNGYSNNPNKLQ